MVGRLLDKMTLVEKILNSGLGKEYKRKMINELIKAEDKNKGFILLLWGWGLLITISSWIWDPTTGAMLGMGVFPILTLLTLKKLRREKRTKLVEPIEMKKRVKLREIIRKIYDVYRTVFFKYFEKFEDGLKGNPTKALMRFKQYPRGMKQLECVPDDKCEKFYNIIKKMRFRPNWREETIRNEDIELAKKVLNELVEEFKGDLMRDEI